MSFFGLFGGGKKVVLGLGSNLGDRKFFIEQGIFHLKEFGSDFTVSSLWESPPWEGISLYPYLNAVMSFSPSLDVRELWSEIQKIEASFEESGTSKGKWADKHLDIDILFFGEDRIHTPSLEIPHKFAKDRAFVLAPLLEIHPDFFFFQEKATAQELYDRLSEYQKKNIVLFSSDTRES